MFDVFYTPKSDDECDCKFTVYDVRCDKNGYPHFLIYVDDQWRYVSAKHCKPWGSYLDEFNYDESDYSELYY